MRMGSADYSSALIQRMMLGKMRERIDSRDHDKQEILIRLTSQNVKIGNNKWIGDNSLATGHVHNTLLPDGGLQQVLAQHNMHVVGYMLCS